MKKTYRYSQIALAVLFTALTLLTTSCIDKDINNSPNAINEEAVKSVEGVYGLTIALQVATADFYSGDRSRVASIWTWQMGAPPGLGRSQPVNWNVYRMEEDGPTNDMWLIAYRGVRIANDIIKFTPEVVFSATPEDNTRIRNTLLGMARTYKALILGEMAAFYGSIPININGLEPPQFVSQTEAYAEVQRLLDEALVNFADPGPVDRDLNFGGDKDKWLAAVHSLKARYFLHLKNYASAASEASQGIADASGTLFGIYGEGASEYSPWGHWTLTEVGEPIRGERYFVNLLKANPNDSRLGEYFTSNDNGQYWGFAVRNQETADSNELNTLKTVSLKKYGAYGDNFPLISWQENQFILAEAKARTGAGGLEELNSVITQFGLPASTATGQDLINEILLQKYLTLFLEGQSYHDMRRTGTLPSPNIPLRWTYPVAETNANPNVPEDNDELVRAILP
ncbi:MAG: SusD/RagB family nutrient-binding outer membrane lipoprotein [Chloroflexota bacterium]